MENDQVQTEIESPEEKESPSVSEKEKNIYTIISILFVLPVCLIAFFSTDTSASNFQFRCLPSIIIPLIATIGLVLLWEKKNVKRQKVGKILIILQITFSILTACIIAGLYSMLILIS